MTSNDPAQQHLNRVLHDLSNSLTGVLMNAGLLSLALRGNERLRRYADDIHDGATHAAALVQHARGLLDEVPDGPEMGNTVTDGCDDQHKQSDAGLRRIRMSCSTRTQ